MEALSLKGVQKTFDKKTQVLNGINLTVEEGEFISILGPSGCGKTTLLRIIAGLEEADAGEISIGGKRAEHLSPKERNIAMVFQSYALYPHLSVYENIAVGLRLRKVPAQEIDTRVQKTAATLEITQLLQRKPKALSGGQRQRVALARSIVRRPSLFLMDEPLSNLDASLRDKSRAELKVLMKRLNGTVIYVTHDQIEASTLSDRVILLKGGLIQQIAGPKEIYNKPANTFVAGFMGTPPMNFFTPAQLKTIRLTTYVDSILGFRPEDIELHEHILPGTFEADIMVEEPIGASTILNLKPAGLSHVIVKVLIDSKRKVPPKLWCRLDPASVHLFDPTTGMRK
ncbi:ABC transporter ATP-binding protein [Elusimicrobiota bacterium]